KIIVEDAGDDRPDAPPGDPDRKALDDFRARKQIAAQQATVMVREAIRQAERLVRLNPDEAYTLLKQTLEGVRDNIDLEPNTVANLTNRLGRAMESVKRTGDIVKRDQAEALALRAAADARLDLRNTVRLAQDRVRERMRIYRNLMDQAREDEAQRQVHLLREDLVNPGLPVPQAVTARHQRGPSAFQP